MKAKPNTYVKPLHRHNQKEPQSIAQKIYPSRTQNFNPFLDMTCHKEHTKSNKEEVEKRKQPQKGNFTDQKPEKTP